MTLLSVLIGILTIIGLIYLYIKRSFSYWKNRNVLHETPKFPLGNIQGLGFSRHLADIVPELYNKFKGKDVIFGMYFFTKPVVVILDPELTKNILIRDFNYFHDRGVYFNEKDDPLSGHLFSIEGVKWKNLRTKLSPTFTSGKMKMMFNTVLNVANEMKIYLEESAENKEIIEMKDLLARYTTDVIGTCAFGIECNSIKNPNAEFRIYGRKVFEPNQIQNLKVLFVSSFRNLCRKLHMKISNSEVEKFFMGVVKETLKFRKENKIERNDFMHLLLQMENNKDTEKSLTVDEIAAQSFLFFLAGFETSSTTMTFCLYELGRHLDIQEKVRSEINDILKKYDGIITYESILEMEYLEKVIKETLRMYPPVDELIRTPNIDYKVPGTDHIIEKGILTLIPVMGFHKDPKYYPNPEKFDPERFSEENLTKRHPFSYLPFGEGPRNCIGMRFGQMQTRLGLVTILKNYRISHCEKTPKTVKFMPKSPIVTIDGGAWLRIEKI